MPIPAPSLIGSGSRITSILRRRSYGSQSRRGLALQLHSVFQVRAFCGGLMGPPPERPSDDVGRLDAPLRKPCGDTADFLCRPVDEGWLCFRIIDGGGFWGGWRFEIGRAHV